MKNIKNRFLVGSIFLLVVFVLAVGVWYSPVLFKGYSTYSMTSNMLIGRNAYLTGLYSAENDLNVLLASDLIEEQGHLSTYGNKLTSLLYAKVFKITGLPSENGLILLSIFIHALTLLISTGIVLYLFNLKTASIFSLVYIFLPFNWRLPYHLGNYEFALFFLALFFLFYFCGIRRKYNYIYFGVSGGFLFLACLSKEAIMLIIPFLLVYLWLIKQKARLIYIFIPLIILFAVFWLPDISRNSYLQMFTTQVSEQNKGTDFSFYAHVYPDPYTYHFEQEEYLKKSQELIDNDQLVLMKEIDRIREFKNMGIWDISLFDRIRAGLMLGSRHVFRFISLEDIGGPFIFLLILLGLYSLRQKKKYLYQFFIYWISSAIFLLAFVVLAGRNHLMDFNWAIALSISLGLIFLVKLINDYFDLKKKKQVFLYIALLFIIIYHLILVNHVTWSRIYDDSDNLIVQSYSQEIKKLDIADSDVIALNLTGAAMYNLSYLTDKSMILFRLETVEDLLEKNKLDWAFEQFGVKYVLGYPDELNEEIVYQTDVINVASNSLELATVEMSRNKGWLMNLIK